MAMGSIFATVPAIAAAAGFYFIGRNDVKVRKVASIVLFRKNIRVCQGKKGYAMFCIAKVQDFLSVGNQTRVIIQSKDASRSERTSKEPSNTEIGTTV